MERVTEPPPTNNDLLAQRLLELRQYAIGVVLSSERSLDAMGYRVESAIVTRQERRAAMREKRIQRNGR